MVYLVTPEEVSHAVPIIMWGNGCHVQHSYPSAVIYILKEVIRYCSWIYLCSWKMLITTSSPNYRHCTESFLRSYGKVCGYLNTPSKTANK